MTTLPRKVIYIDLISSWWPDPTADIRAAADAGYNVINLCFYLINTVVDIVYMWSSIATPEQRRYTLDYLHSKGAVLILSCGGATAEPYNLLTGIEYGTQTANFAKQYEFDGVDYDLEGFNSGLTYTNLNSEQVIDWLSDCFRASRDIMGPNAIISTAPQAPYFSPIGSTDTWAGSAGGFVGINAKVGSMIDFYNVQFYNQGAQSYVTYQNLFLTSVAPFPKTSVKEIADAGIPLEKIVVGKPMTPEDAANGYVNLSQLGGWFVQAQNELGYNKSIMFWQWRNFDSAKAALDQIYPQTAEIKPRKKKLLLECKERKCHDGRKYLTCKVINRKH